jgi:putative heme-binding domain-containing protein
LFERFLPDVKRTQRIAAAINPADILSRTGDAARGRALLLETAGVQCKNCHRLEQSGAELGPNLSESVKKLSRAQLLESILQPSKSIDPKYMAYVVETSDGRVVNGLLAEKTDTEVVLKDATNKPVRIPVADVELLAPQSVSLMPELLLKDMTAQQVADMLAYLESLKAGQ